MRVKRGSFSARVLRAAYKQNHRVSAKYARVPINFVVGKKNVELGTSFTLCIHENVNETVRLPPRDFRTELV